ncbi:hypothetical protein AGMMS49992_26320 [Clostridia bacterium]|nr:hypothetical protein AGMMS49992_26320 [Clostridia bacterium]
MSMPRLYIKGHNDLQQALANIALSVAMEDTAVTNMLNAEQRKLAMFANPDNPFLQSAREGGQPRTSVKDLVKLDHTAANLIGNLNRLQQMLITKYTVAASMYTQRAIDCQNPCDSIPDWPDGSLDDTPCECNCEGCQMPDVKPDCPCGFDQDDGLPSTCSCVKPI